nr:deoxyribose-phosphate aldolase [Lachnospiraceae bacterium]
MMIGNMTPEQLAKYFDHTQLRAYAAYRDFETLCAESRRYGFAMVAVNSAPVRFCKELLSGTDIHVGAAISFPLGQTTIEDKVAETKNAIMNGAD